MTTPQKQNLHFSLTEKMRLLLTVGRIPDDSREEQQDAQTAQTCHIQELGVWADTHHTVRSRCGAANAREMKAKPGAQPTLRRSVQKPSVSEPHTFFSLICGRSFLDFSTPISRSLKFASGVGVERVGVMPHQKKKKQQPAFTLAFW